jgi:predicted transcriptional regulator
MIVYQGDNFKRYLDKKEISVTRAAKILGVSRQNVYQYFKSNNLTPETVNSIVDSFKASLDEIFPQTDKETLSYNPETKSDPMQSRELIQMQKKVIEMQEAEIKRLKEELEKIKGDNNHQNSLKGNSSAS